MQATITTTAPPAPARMPGLHRLHISLDMGSTPVWSFVWSILRERNTLLAELQDQICSFTYQPVLRQLEQAHHQRSQLVLTGEDAYRFAALADFQARRLVEQGAAHAMNAPLLRVAERCVRGVMRQLEAS